MYAIGANAPSFEWHANLEHWSSFPSDNATYLFAIAASLWLRRRYQRKTPQRDTSRRPLPGDVLVGALIGIATSIAINRESVRKRFAAPILALEPRYKPFFSALFFLTLAELSGGFPNARRIGVAIVISPLRRRHSCRHRREP